MEKEKFKTSISFILMVVHTLATVLFFSIFMSILLVETTKIFKDLNTGQLSAYFSKQKQDLRVSEPIVPDKYNCFFIDEYLRKTNDNVEKNQDFANHFYGKERKELGNIEIVADYLKTNLAKIIKDKIKTLKEDDAKTITKIITYKKDYKEYTILLEITQQKKDDKIILSILGAYTDGEFVNYNKRKFTIYSSTGLIFLLLFTNVLNYFLTYFLIAKRLKILSDDVINLPRHNYQKPILTLGNDEITRLSKKIDGLRKEILIGEIAKRDMLQNMSHDIKNPIGIIKSYAEAIYDGVADKENIKIILEKADELTRRITLLINYVKAEYLEEKSKDYKEFLVKNVLEKLVNDNKYRFQGSITANLDNSKYIGNIEKFSIAIQNILENALRYAKSKIEIILTKKRLTIFNDGPTINPEFIDSMFTIYQKSNDGNFGIGLSITKVTLLKFGLNIKVENCENGVLFIIKPI